MYYRYMLFTLIYFTVLHRKFTYSGSYFNFVFKDIYIYIYIYIEINIYIYIYIYIVMHRVYVL